MKKARARQAATTSRIPKLFAEYLLIVAAVLIVYSPALEGGLLWDDPGHITRPELRSLHGLWRIWSELGATQQYYPVLHSAFWLEHRLWGDALPGYHLANVLLHATSAFLVLLIVRRLALPGALLAALIFALHPVGVESVAWISEQKNTLSAALYLASALAYLSFDEHRRRSAYSVALALFALALLSKTVTATLPAALLVVFWWWRGRLSWQRDVLPLIPWFAMAAVAGLYTAWFEREVIGAKGADFALTFVERCLLAGRVIWFYLGKLAWPNPLIFIYPRWRIDASVWSQYLPLAGLFLLVAGLWTIRRRTRGPLAGFLLFAGTLFPVLGFFNVYPFRYSYVADHFQYLASLGAIVPFSAGVTHLMGRVGFVGGASRASVSIAASLLVAVLGVSTWRQASIYRDAETLYRETITRNPDAWMAYMNLGTELASDPDRLREAIAAYEGALRIRPDYPEARRNLARAQSLLSDAEAAAHLNLGSDYAGTPGRLSDAIAEYEKALRIKPDYFRAHYNLGTVLLDVPGREREAIAHLERALEIEPDSVEAHVNLGVALADLPGRKEEAIRHLEFAIARRSDLGHLKELIDRLR